MTTYTKDELGFLYFSVNEAKKVKADYLSGLSFFNFSKEKKSMKENVKYLSALLEKIDYALADIIANNKIDYEFNDGETRVFAYMALNYKTSVAEHSDDRAILEGIIEKMPK